MKYPIGIQNFEEIREGGYLYIDKTDMMFDLVDNGKYYFLSRPRRFGKSLLISTLETYFSGKREMFEGLKIAELEKEWAVYPVLHLDLNTKRYENKASLLEILNMHLEMWEAEYGDEKKDRSPEERFMYVIRCAYEKTGKQVVILVDEYDKPMLQAIDDEELQNEYRNTLKAFYGALKSMDRYIRFALLTGVTKFGKVSVFSDLNNLRDISMEFAYVGICGITEEELHSEFKEGIKELGAANDMSEEETKAKLKELYDGYHFNEDCVDIYNPFSILNTFAKKRFGDYWFETGTPTFLVELMKGCGYSLKKLMREYATADSLNGLETFRKNPVPILYQSGYLTIKDYDSRFKTYILGFPNKEVENGFMEFLLPSYTGMDNSEATFGVMNFVKDIENGDTDSFMKRLTTFFADTPYELARDLELHYQNVMFILFKLLGFYTQAEYHTSEGRIDMVVKTKDYIYVMEFKLDGTAEEAMQQIESKDYALPFECDGRKLVKVGVNFSYEKRNVERWIVKE